MRRAGPGAFAAWAVMAYGLALYAVYAVTVKAGAWARGMLRHQPRVVTHADGRQGYIKDGRYRPMKKDYK